MPIAKANMGNGFSGVMGYVLVQKDVAQELQPKVIECNNVLQSSSDNIARQMRNLAQDNGTKKPVMHMQISFHPDEKLSFEQAQKAINSIIKDAGIDRNNHQFLVVEHFDKNHQHFHVVCNRVGLDNKLLNDSHLKIKLNVACDKVEKEQGLRPTEGRQYQFDVITGEGKFVKVEKTKEQVKKLPNDKREKIKAVKERVQNKVIDVLQSAKTTQEFKEKLAEKGVEVRFSEDRANNNAIRGASFRTDDVAVKGGDIGFKWNEISTILEANLSQGQNQKIAAPGQTAAAPAQIKSETFETTEKPVLSEAIKHKMMLFIEQNPEKISANDHLTDQAIRIYMKEINPHANSWDTWEAHRHHKKQRQEFDQYAALKLSEAKAIEVTVQPERGTVNKVKDEINKEVRAVLAKPETQSPEKLYQGLKEKGIEVRFLENESGISHISFQSQGFSFEGYEVGYADQNINKALNANRLPKTAEIDNAKAYAIAVKQTIIQFKDEAQRGNVIFDVQTMFVENIKKHISSPDAATIQKFQEDLPKFQKAQQQLLHDHEIHQKEHKNEVFHPTVHLYDRNFGKNATFKDQEKELKNHIKEKTDQVIKASQSQDQEPKKSREREM